jgi:ABC-type transport system involved in cytochrome bd biosynthesis fused ATPase/permease subunit
MGTNLLPVIKVIGLLIIGGIAVMCEKVQAGTAHLPFASASVMTAFPVISNFHNLYSSGVLS